MADQPQQQKQPQCVDCEYFEPEAYTRYDFGACHRYPPMQLVNMPENVAQYDRLHAHFAPVKPTDWCGEFKQKGQATEWQ